MWSSLKEKNILKAVFTLPSKGFFTFFFGSEIGLTALRSDEVIDLMIKEYPAKHAEYSVILQEKERQRITDHYKEYSVGVEGAGACGLGKCQVIRVQSLALSCFYFSKCNNRTLRKLKPAKCPSTLRKLPGRPRSSTAT